MIEIMTKTDGFVFAVVFCAMVLDFISGTVVAVIQHKWQPVYSSFAGFAWELVEDPDALGTMKNPLRWTEGREVKAGYHYTDGTRLYVALEDGTPTGIEDETYFAEV